MKDSIYRHWMKKMEEDHEVFLKSRNILKIKVLFFLLFYLCFCFFIRNIFFPGFHFYNFSFI